MGLSMKYTVQVTLLTQHLQLWLLESFISISREVPVFSLRIQRVGGASVHWGSQTHMHVIYIYIERGMYGRGVWSQGRVSYFRSALSSLHNPLPEGRSCAECCLHQLAQMPLDWDVITCAWSEMSLLADRAVSPGTPRSYDEELYVLCVRVCAGSVPQERTHTLLPICSHSHPILLPCLGRLVQCKWMNSVFDHSKKPLHRWWPCVCVCVFKHALTPSLPHHMLTSAAAYWLIVAEGGKVPNAPFGMLIDCSHLPHSNTFFISTRHPQPAAAPLCGMSSSSSSSSSLSILNALTPLPSYW